MDNLMTSEDEFELALQEYLKAVTLYKLAIKRYVEDVGLTEARPKLQEAGDRVCYQDAATTTPIIMSPQGFKQSVKRARPTVDANKGADDEEI